MNSKTENVDLVAMLLKKTSIVERQYELLTRVLSACVLVPFFVWITHLGNWLFFGAVTLIFISALREWSRLATASIFHPLCFFALIVFAHYHFPDYAIYITVIGGLSLFGLVYWQFKTINLPSKQNWVILISGILYISASMEFFIQLRQNSSFFILWLYGIVWATDSGAYLIGRTLKGPKFSPRISPNKTWSGFVGGIITAIIVETCFLNFLEVSSFSTSKIIIVLFLSLAAHMGDLIESSAKRYFGVKNAGGLIPGHGGILDRLDSLFLVIIVAKIFILTGLIRF